MNVDIKKYDFKEEINFNNIDSLKIVVFKLLYFFEMGHFIEGTKHIYLDREDKQMEDLFIYISFINKVLENIELYKIADKKNKERKNTYIKVVEIREELSICLGGLEKIVDKLPKEIEWMNQLFFNVWLEKNI